MLEELERRISEHFYNEAKILKDMLEAELTKDESEGLERFIKNHPFSQLSHYLQELSRLKESQAKISVLSKSAE